MPDDETSLPDAKQSANGAAEAAQAAAQAADEAEERADVVEDAGKVAHRMQERLVMDADGLPKALKWRPHVSWKAMAAGAIADVAVELILQQAGLLLLDGRDLIEGIIQGSVLGACAPMVGSIFGVLWVNTRIARMRAEAA